MYRSVPIKSDNTKDYAMLDGFGRIPNCIGPFRSNGEVCYYDVITNEYINPKSDLQLFRAQYNYKG